MTDPFDLDRFVRAQEADGTYDRALAELRAGRKRSHWMWFVFPQLAGLGRSATAQRYAIASLDEARAYLTHPLLGPRLRTCVQALLDLPPDATLPADPADPAGPAGPAGPGPTAADILGAIDALKLRSSLTLFARAAPADPLFHAALARYCDGEPDAATDDLLRSSGETSPTL